MKPEELKIEYIRLRAEGNSYSMIAEKLHISKTTCTRWEQELSSSISELKQAELAELSESYGLHKEARIRRLGESLAKIDEALAQIDYRTIPAEKLLDLKLKFSEALKSEYVSNVVIAEPPTDGEGIVKAFANLLARVQAGDISNEQAQKESAVLTQLMKAYENVELKTKLDELNAFVRSH